MLFAGSVAEKIDDHDLESCRHMTCFGYPNSSDSHSHSLVAIQHCSL